MILTGVSLLVLAIDQSTKFLILKSIPLGGSLPIVPGYLYFTYTQNPGTAFGFMSNMSPVIRAPFFIAITFIAALFVYSYQKAAPEGKFMLPVALGFIWGGALGNLVDRLLYGKVVDYIDVRCFDFWRYRLFTLG